MNELVIYMAGAILLLTVVLAVCIVWMTIEVNQLRRTEKKIQRLAKAASTYFYTLEGDAAHERARRRLLDCLSGLMEDV